MLSFLLFTILNSISQTAEQAWGYLPDTKIKIISGTASHYQPGENINMSFDGDMNTMIGYRTSHMEIGDVFCKLISFWQLELYYSHVKGQRDFYAYVQEQICSNHVSDSDGEQQIQFMKICCDVAHTDFTGIFTKWGMLRLIDQTTVNLSSIQEEQYYSKGFKITQQQVDDLKKYATHYKKPTQNIHYIHDNVRTQFTKNLPVEQGKIERGEDSFHISGWKNVVVYEIYNGDKLLAITLMNDFSVSFKHENLIIRAIPASGSPLVVELK